MATTKISSVTYDKNSRYVQGGLTEVGAIGLEWWNKYVIPSDPTDQLYIVEEKYNGRPDLIANAFYEDWRLWWVIAQFNNILDPYLEMGTGAILYIPTYDRVQALFTSRTGGTPSARQNSAILPPIVL